MFFLFALRSTAGLGTELLANYLFAFPFTCTSSCAGLENKNDVIREPWIEREIRQQHGRRVAHGSLAQTDKKDTNICIFSTHGSFAFSYTQTELEKDREPESFAIIRMYKGSHRHSMSQRSGYMKQLLAKAHCRERLERRTSD